MRPALGIPSEEEVVSGAFPLLRRISIDYGVVERAVEVYVLPADIGWSDVGAWTALERFTLTPRKQER